MANANSRVTIHMAASLDGFIARRDGRVDWLETSDEFEGAAGDRLQPGTDTCRNHVDSRKTGRLNNVAEPVARSHPRTCFVHYLRTNCICRKIGRSRLESGSMKRPTT
jgi:hypothetical protein